MIPLILTADEVRAAVAGTLTEIRRPVQDPPRHWSEVDYLDGTTAPTGYVRVEPSRDGLFIWSMDPRRPEPARLSPFGAPGSLLYVCEAWRSWQCQYNEDWDHDFDFSGDLAAAPQTYVAYEATPRHGFRPVPDRAAITYLDESTPLDRNPRLLGPWQSAESMPAWASRLAFRNRGVRVEQADGAWSWAVTVERVDGPNGAPKVPVEIA